MRVRFEWDKKKFKANVNKHGVDFFEASTVFYDDYAYVAPDASHSLGEFRYFILGQTSQGRLLNVSYTERGDVIRLISAREATNAERKGYEEGKEIER